MNVQNTESSNCKGCKDVVRFKSDVEKRAEQRLCELLKNTEIQNNSLLENLGLFTERKALSHTIFMNDIYKKILDVPGIIVEFGVKYGRNLALLSNFRGMYEPYNHLRKIVGFDTFDGYKGVGEKDSKNNFLTNDMMNTTEKYEEELNEIMSCHEKLSPISHMKKFEIIKGNAQVTFKSYLEGHPETIVALVFLDINLYQPTKDVLILCKEKMIKGTTFVFQNFADKRASAEIQALDDIFGLKNLQIKKFQYKNYSYFSIN